MKVLITGGAGFIGSHLADHLLAAGEEVLVVDNYATGRRDNLAPHPRLRVVEGTIADLALVDRIFDEFRPEQVVHAAASYKDPEDWSEDARTNVVGPRQILDFIAGGSGLEVLRDGSPRRASKPRDVRLALSWSYRLLRHNEAALLRGDAAAALPVIQRGLALCEMWGFEIWGGWLLDSLARACLLMRQADQAA